MSKVESELVSLLTEREAAYDEEKAALEKVMTTSPQVAAQLCKVFLQQKHRLKAALGEAQKTDIELREIIKKISLPPWYPCEFLRYSERIEKATVLAGNRKIAVSIHPDIQKYLDTLRPGSELFLNHEMNVIIATGDDYARSGEVGIFDRWDRGRIVLKGTADQEFVVDVSGELAETELKPGDAILFDREIRIAYEKIQKNRIQRYLVEDTPNVSFEDIGGLDSVVDELLDEINLHQIHPELARQHKLTRAKGIVLSGPPGCGKTMLARALANYVGTYHQNGHGGAKFLSIPPGSHRSMWFGQSEANVREIFELAKEISSREGLPTILFFDELDNLGSRSNDVINVIDSRILDTFLACIDGVEDAGNIFLIGASNRPDLLDAALFRPGRFADMVFHIPRPDRVAAKRIFEKYLTPELPFYDGNGRTPEDLAEEMIDSALSYIYSPRGESNLIANLTLRDGSKRPVRAPDFMSGATIANVVRQAKRKSCLRAARGLAAGITREDLLEAIDIELDSVCTRLKTIRNIHTIMTELPLDVDVVKVEVHTRSERPRTHEYIRSVQ